MKNGRLMIYFAYSGRDKDGSNPAGQAVHCLTRPGNDGSVYAEATAHSKGIPTEDKSFLEKNLTKIRRSVISKWLYAFFAWSLGEWFIRKKAGWSSETEDWRVEAEKLIEESDILVFLYSENSRNEDNAGNIIWEMETAKRLDRNIILCSLDRDGQDEPPEWVKKVDRNALNFCYTQEQLRKRIESHNVKQSSFTNMNLRDLSDSPDSKAAERMFEQYRMYKEEADNLVNARQTSSNFFMLMNGALLTLIGVVLDPEQTPLLLKIVLGVSGCAGIFICQSWANMISHYKDLHTAKERLINAIEEYLPLQLNSTEYYGIMKDPLNKGRYKSFGETVIPDTMHAGWGFLFLCAFVSVLYSLVLFAWKRFWGRVCLCVIVAAVLMEPFLESILHTRTRTQKGATHGHTFH